MGIQSVTEVSHRAPAPPPVPPVASGAAAADRSGKGATPQPVHVASAAPPTPPPPPPSKGFNMDVQIGIHEETNTKVYSFVDPDSGDTVVQIPIPNVLNLVASILRRMEAEGQR
jgi:hypothetical protein